MCIVVLVLRQQQLYVLHESFQWWLPCLFKLFYHVVFFTLRAKGQKDKRTKGKIMIYKTPHRKLQIEQYELLYYLGWIQELRRVSSTRYISGTCTSCFMINDIMRKRHQKNWVLSFIFVSRTNLLSIINLLSWVFCSIFEVRWNIYDRRLVSNRRPLLKSRPLTSLSQITVQC